MNGSKFLDIVELEIQPISSKFGKLDDFCRPFLFNNNKHTLHVNCIKEEELKLNKLVRTLNSFVAVRKMAIFKVPY